MIAASALNFIQLNDITKQQKSLSAPLLRLRLTYPGARLLERSDTTLSQTDRPATGDFRLDAVAARARPRLRRELERKRDPAARATTSPLLSSLTRLVVWLVARRPSSKQGN